MSALRQPIVAASIVAGVAYLLLWDAGIGEPAATLFKGICVGLLAVEAARRARSVDGWLLALVMALGATADMVLNHDFRAGAAIFGVGHIVAILLYLRNRRPLAAMPPSQIGAALSLLLLGPLVVTMTFPEGAGDRSFYILYALLICTMAATAWTSRFSRLRTGVGAVMFVMSDALIMGRLAGLDGWLLGAAIWGLYYGGQLLIFLGVSDRLNRPQPAPPLHPHR